MTSSSPFADLAAFAALPRATGLALSADGRRLVAVVQEPDAKGARYASALWDVPLDGGPASRLTWSEQGESAPAFLPDGSLLFVSSRPRPEGEDEPALWLLPPSGEARVVLERPGGVGGAVVARDSGAFVVSGSRLAYSTDADDRERRTTRSDRKISAILHSGLPIRYWDHELGHETPRLLYSSAVESEVVDLAPDARLELFEAHASVSAGGRVVVTDWRRPAAFGRTDLCVAVFDVAAGTHRVWHEPGFELDGPAVSPDGARIAVRRESIATFAAPPYPELVVAPVDGGATIRCELGDLHPTQWVWAPDSRTLYVTGDLHGRGAVLALDASTGALLRTVADDAVYTSLAVDPSGRFLYALRSTLDVPPAPVRLAADGERDVPVALGCITPPLQLPGSLVELDVPAADGASVHGWLVLPAPADRPAPVMLFIHGGPFSSSNAWSWRWNAWVAAARGWAVVQPDPALSTGYGNGWRERAWPYRAEEVFADCATVLDAVLQRPDVDETRVACLGGSFGGYMTNWIAGNTDRFGAIVTHAGLWALDQQHSTSDISDYKTSIFGHLPDDHPDWHAANSPNRSAARVRTPLLVTHGARDFRVPFSEALRLWWDLASRWDGDPDEFPHRFLEFTSENHWILGPANWQIWWDTILGFCGQHVLGRPWTPSALL